jgi:hypothetical protein
MMIAHNRAATTNPQYRFVKTKNSHRKSEPLNLPFFLRTKYKQHIPPKVPKRNYPLNILLTQARFFLKGVPINWCEKDIRTKSSSEAN